MSFTWAINPLNADVFLNRSSSLQIVTGEEEVKQRIIVALNHFYGEYFLDVPGGIPWYAGQTFTGQQFIGLLGSKDLRMASAIIRLVVLNVPGVLSIANFNLAFDPVTRIASLGMQIEVEGTTGPSIIDIIHNLTITP